MHDNTTLILSAVVKTLNSISVNGKDNMIKLSNCITVLEKILNNDTRNIHVECEPKESDKEDV